MKSTPDLPTLEQIEEGLAACEHVPHTELYRAYSSEQLRDALAVAKYVDRHGLHNKPAWDLPLGVDPRDRHAVAAAQARAKKLRSVDPYKHLLPRKESAGPENA